MHAILGMTDEGTCEHCGANCPLRRVAVVQVFADGSRGDVARWGVCCAALARTGSKSAADQRRVVAAAEAADRQAAAEAADRDRRYRHRLAGPVDAGWLDNPKAAANARYRATGRPFEGSYLAADQAGQVIRIDGSDPHDVELFAGFAAITAPAAAI